MSGKRKAPRPEGNRARTGAGRFRPGESGNPAGRPPGRPNVATVQAREAARGLVGDPDYLKRLRARLVAGELPGTVEAMLWAYAWGRPTEHVEMVHDVAPALFEDWPTEKLLPLARRTVETLEREVREAKARR